MACSISADAGSNALLQGWPHGRLVECQKKLHAEQAREPGLFVSVRHAALADRLPFSSCVCLGKGFHQHVESSMLKLRRVRFSNLLLKRNI